jgi:peptidoglycan biosynthesis protein MviN/MurJ (putative lipid II flippase)
VCVCLCGCATSNITVPQHTSHHNKTPHKDTQPTSRWLLLLGALLTPVLLLSMPAAPSACSFPAAPCLTDPTDTFSKTKEAHCVVPQLTIEFRFSSILCSITI